MLKKAIPMLVIMIFLNPGLLWAKEDCGKFGALVIAHGSHKGGHHPIQLGSEHDHWNETVIAAVGEVKKRIDFPLELAFGMWDKESFQAGVDKLASQGICALKVVPLFISSDSEMIEIQKYMFGVKKNFNFPISISKVTIPSQIKKVHFQKALDNHEYVSEILSERISEISERPDAEGVILIAHGPYTDFYEPRWLDLLKLHGERVQASFASSRGEKFKEMSFFTLRDDSPAQTRDERTRQIRNKIKELNQRHLNPIVVPVILSAGGIEEGIFKRLEGLEYVISNRYLMPHQKMIDWIEFRAKE